MVVETNRALDKYFPNSTFNGRHIVLMAEPGQYLVFEAVTLVVSIIGKKDGRDSKYLSFIDDEDILDPSLSRKSVVDATIDSSAIGSAEASAALVIGRTVVLQNERSANSIPQEEEISSTPALLLSKNHEDRNRKTSLSSSASDGDEASSSLLSAGGTSSENSSSSSGVVGCSKSKSRESEQKSFIYYLSDGKYGTFTYLAYVEDLLYCELVKKVIYSAKAL